jgi:spore maturation protein A
MINYFWIGLIISAVFFAVFLDITGQKPYEQPEPVMLQDFSEGNPDWKVLTIGGEANGWIFGKTAKRDTDITGSFGRLEYSLESSSEVVLEAGEKIESATVVDDLSRVSRVMPDGLEFRLRADGSGHLLEVEIIDEDGELFVGQLPGKLNWEGRWKKVRLSFSDLAPSAENPAARLDFPITLDRVALIRSRSAPVRQGAIDFDTVRVLYPERIFSREDLRAETWMGVVTQSAARWAELAITLAIQLIGIMMLWLGLMRIAEQAGLVQALARLFKPVMCRLFPDIPPDGEAMGAILMNMAANMLGLGNAATPLGLKAMEELQKLNKNKEYASNAMCMLLSLNTSSVELIPATIIGYRVAAGSTNIMQFWPLMVATTFASTLVAVLVCKFCEKLPVFQVPPPAPAAVGASSDEEVRS